MAEVAGMVVREIEEVEEREQTSTQSCMLCDCSLKLKVLLAQIQTMIDGGGGILTRIVI